MKSLRSPAVTTRGPKNEPYPDFQKRVAADYKRAQAKCDALNQFTPCCRSCGETCDPIDAGTPCEENGAPMTSRWARKKAQREWYQLGHFGGAWLSEVENLAALLDRVRAGETETG
jgi:hypothetical protein